MILETIVTAIASGALTPFAQEMLKSLGVTVKDSVLDIVKEKIKNFANKNDDNIAILVKDLKTVDELKDINENHIAGAFYTTFGNITNSDVTSLVAPNARDVYQNCTFKNDMDKQEIKELIFETLQTIPLDNPKTIERLRPFFNKAYRAIEECYDYEDKKDIIKKLIKERIEKSVNDDFIEIREYDTAIEITAKLTKEELNLLALCYIAKFINLETVLTTKVIKECNLNESQIEKLVIYFYFDFIKKFLPIDIIDKTSTATIFAQYGLNITDSSHAGPIFLYKDKSMLNQILADPSMEFLKEHIDIFKRYLLQFSNHRGFQRIAGIYFGEKIGERTVNILEILKDITE